MISVSFFPSTSSSNTLCGVATPAQTNSLVARHAQIVVVVGAAAAQAAALDATKR